MKNDGIRARLGYAFAGILSSLRGERSFRTHVLCFVLVLAMLVISRPEPLWWVMLLLTSGCVLSAELINTAVEKLADHLHPGLHPALKSVKDCLAGAVLIMVIVAVFVFLAFLWALALHPARI